MYLTLNKETTRVNNMKLLLRFIPFGYICPMNKRENQIFAVCKNVRGLCVFPCVVRWKIEIIIQIIQVSNHKIASILKGFFFGVGVHIL